MLKQGATTEIIFRLFENDGITPKALANKISETTKQIASDKGWRLEVGGGVDRLNSATLILLTCYYHKGIEIDPFTKDTNVIIGHYTINPSNSRG